MLQRTAKKCRKNNKACAQPLLCSFNLLFCGLLKLPNINFNATQRNAECQVKLENSNLFVVFYSSGSLCLFLGEVIMNPLFDINILMSWNEKNVVYTGKCKPVTDKT